MFYLKVYIFFVHAKNAGWLLCSNEKYKVTLNNNIIPPCGDQKIKGLLFTFIKIKMWLYPILQLPLCFTLILTFPYPMEIRAFKKYFSTLLKSRGGVLFNSSVLLAKSVIYRYKQKPPLKRDMQKIPELP